MAKDDELVISGAGVVCHLGTGLDPVVDALEAGVPTPFLPIPEAAAVGCRCTHMGRVTADLSDEALGVTRREGRFLGRAARLGLLAARHALASAGLEGVRDLAVLVASGSGDADTHMDIQSRLDRTGAARRVSPTVVPKLMSSTVSANLVNALRTTGPSASVAAACAGGAWNLATGALLVKEGLARAALVGGAECWDLHMHCGFDRMRAYCADEDGTPTTMSRPYAADRAGFVFGEGAGILVLERRRDAEARGAVPLAVLRGVGMSSDGQGEMVQPSRDGAARAVAAALAHAGVAAEEVAYVNTHATSTPVGDVEEVRGLESVLGTSVPYSSTKGATGHGVSAAGALEALFTAAALQRRRAPGAWHADPLDPALEDHPPLRAPTALDGEVALSNSFGFGGTNVCVVLERAG